MRSRGSCWGREVVNKGFNPVANIFPLMQGPEFQALVDDIRANGLREELTLDERGDILDGRNRYRACLEAKVEPNFRKWNGTGSPIAFVVSMNLHRRHLDESQRAMVAARLATMRQGGDRTKSPIGELTQTEAASLLNVGKRTVERARKVLDHGTPELADAVTSGKLPLSLAAAVSDRTPDFQHAVVTKLADGAKPVEAVRQARREATARDPDALPDRKYRVIYADPPWPYGNAGLDRYGHAEAHYKTLSLNDICALSVSDVAADDAVLFLWSTSPMLEDAFKVIKAWRFDYKTSFVWDKVKHNFGHYNSVRHEFLLVATRGSCTPDNSKLTDSVQTIERSDKHSEKPEEFRKIIESMYTTGKRIELFSRAKHPRWDAWGDEV